MDVAEYISVDTAACFTREAGVSFASVRAWHSYGAFDTNAPVTVPNMWQAGYAHVDVYVFPCISMSAESQVQ